MKKVWYLKAEKEECIKAVKLFLYEKNGKTAGKLDLSAFRDEGDENIVLQFRNREDLEIGSIELELRTPSGELYLQGKGQLREEIVQNLEKEKGEIQLSLTIGKKTYLSEGWVGQHTGESGGSRDNKEIGETKAKEEETEQLPELEAEELLPEESSGKRVVQLSTLEEELLFRKYVHNSFLLHGYYNYGHVVIDETGENPRLGVPGNYYEREQMVAAMFGFPDFEPAKEKERIVNGTFGYYYTAENG